MREHPDFDIIKQKIENADLIYVGGGNTRTMLALWRRLGVDRLLHEAAQRGTVLSGLSAGANCWFHYANSDAPIIEGEVGIKTVRVEEFTNMMRTTPGIGIGLDDVCALQIRGQEYRVVANEEGAVAHKIYWDHDQFHHNIIQPSEEFHPLDSL